MIQIRDDDSPFSRSLRRSRSRRVIAGVCGGIGEWLGWQPNLVRLGFLVAACLSLWSALILYTVLAFAMPEDVRSDYVRGWWEEERDRF